METDIKAKIEITPAILAKAFWNMDDKEQAQFFTELFNFTSETYNNRKKNDWWIQDEFGTSQWYSLANTIQKIGGNTYKIYLRFCSFAYKFFEPKG